MIALAMDERMDPVLTSRVPEREEKLLLHPSGLHGKGRSEHEEPVAAISSWHCWAATMLVPLNQTGTPLALRSTASFEAERESRLEWERKTLVGAGARVSAPDARDRTQSLPPGDRGYVGRERRGPFPHATT